MFIYWKTFSFFVCLFWFFMFFWAWENNKGLDKWHLIFLSRANVNIFVCFVYCCLNVVFNCFYWDAATTERDEVILTCVTLRSASYGRVFSHKLGPKKAVWASTFQRSPSSLYLSSGQITSLLFDVDLPGNREIEII